MNESIALEGAPGFSASAAHTVSRVHLPFEFRGNGGEYFRIWIVNLLLTIVTLGIYSAWAKVRRLRYFYGNTYLDGHSFEFHGRPLAILKGRLIVFAAYLVFAFSAQLKPAIAFVMIPLACLLPGEFSRRGQLRRVLLAVALAFLFQAVDLGVKNLAARNLGMVPLMYLVDLLPLALGFLFLMSDSIRIRFRRPAPATT